MPTHDPTSGSLHVASTPTRPEPHGRSRLRAWTGAQETQPPPAAATAGPPVPTALVGAPVRPQGRAGSPRPAPSAAALEELVVRDSELPGIEAELHGLRATPLPPRAPWPSTSPPGPRRTSAGNPNRGDRPVLHHRGPGSGRQRPLDIERRQRLEPLHAVRLRALTKRPIPGRRPWRWAPSASTASSPSWSRVRTRELAIRATLGARPAALLGLVLAAGGRVVVLGVGGGAVLALAAARVVAWATSNPVVWAGAILLVAGVAAAAHVGPARRVVRIDLKRALQVD